MTKITFSVVIPSILLLTIGLLTALRWFQPAVLSLDMILLVWVSFFVVLAVLKTK